MKKLLALLLLIFSLASSGQEQILNGISLNGPNGFTKVGDLHWNNQNENIIVQSIKFPEELNQKWVIPDAELEIACKEGTRASTFVDFVNLEISGTTYGFCLQKGENKLDIASTVVYRNGYAYTIMVSAEPDRFERCFEILGYMIARIKSF
jgi:hypothetical protein